MPRINRDWERCRSSMLNQGSEIALRGDFSGEIKNNYDFQVQTNTLMPCFLNLFNLNFRTVNGAAKILLG